MHVRFATSFLLVAAPLSASAVAGNRAGQAPAATAMTVSASSARLPRVSSYFGVRADPLQGVPAMHRGVDLPGPSGTPVLAVTSGTVRFAGRRGGFGNMVEVQDADGTSTRYAHLSRILVRPGAAVAQGSVIALMGSTGRSTGSHLHFEILVDGHAVDPLPFFSGAVPGAAFPERAIASGPTPAHRSTFAQARAMARSLPDREAGLPTGINATAE